MHNIFPLLKCHNISKVLKDAWYFNKKNKLSSKRVE